MLVLAVVASLFAELPQLDDEQALNLLAAGGEEGLEILPVWENDGEFVGSLVLSEGQGAWWPGGPWVDVRDEQATIHRWEKDGVRIWTRVQKWDKRDYQHFLQRASYHEDFMFGLGWTSVGDYDGYRDSGYAGPAVGFPPAPPGLSSQSLQTKFQLPEDTDGDGSIDRTRYRMATTWRRAGESLEAFIARHDLFEEKMMEQGWIPYA